MPENQAICLFHKLSELLILLSCWDSTQRAKVQETLVSLLWNAWKPIFRFDFNHLKSCIEVGKF